MSIRITRITSITRIALLTFAACAVAAPSPAQARVGYRVLATTKTSTMEKELNEAGAAGYRFVAVMGGDTAMGGSEVVMLVAHDNDDKGKYEFRLLATNKTSTLQKELQQAADAGWNAVGQTVFSSTFGGRETVAILQRSASAPRATRFEYKLIATSKTSTLQRELTAAAEQGYEAVGMTVAQTAFGGNELVVITRRPAK